MAKKKNRFEHGRIHAPTFTHGLDAFRSVCGKTGEVNTATPGDAVTCIDCLKKLSKAPQYANFLKAQFQIDAQGARWSHGAVAKAS